MEPPSSGPTSASRLYPTEVPTVKHYAVDISKKPSDKFVSVSLKLRSSIIKTIQVLSEEAATYTKAVHEAPERRREWKAVDLTRFAEKAPAGAETLAYMNVKALAEQLLLPGEKKKTLVKTIEEATPEELEKLMKQRLMEKTGETTVVELHKLQPGLAPGQLRQIVEYLDANSKQLVKEAQKQRKPIHSKPSETRLPRAITVFPDGTIYIDLKTKGVKLIGKGGQKTVKLALDYNKRAMVANVIINVEKSMDEDYYVGGIEARKNEILFDKKLKEIPGVGHYTHQVDYVSANKQKKCAFYMPLLKGGDLTGLQTEKIPGPAKIDMSQQIVQSVAQAHKLGVAFMDLKEANILLEEVPNETYSNLKTQIIDLGAARDTRDLGTLGPVTASYEPYDAAKVTKNGYTTEFFEKRDVYCVGLALWKVVYGSTSPLTVIWGDSAKERFYKSLKEPPPGTLEHVVWKALGPHAERPTAAELNQSLKNIQKTGELFKNATANELVTQYKGHEDQFFEDLSSAAYNGFITQEKLDDLLIKSMSLAVEKKNEAMINTYFSLMPLFVTRGRFSLSTLRNSSRVLTATQPEKVENLFPRTMNLLLEAINSEPPSLQAFNSLLTLHKERPSEAVANEISNRLPEWIKKGLIDKGDFRIVGFKKPALQPPLSKTLIESLHQAAKGGEATLSEARAQATLKAAFQNASLEEVEKLAVDNSKELLALHLSPSEFVYQAARSKHGENLAEIEKAVRHYYDIIVEQGAIKKVGETYDLSLDFYEVSAKEKILDCSFYTDALRKFSYKMQDAVGSSITKQQAGAYISRIYSLLIHAEFSTPPSAQNLNSLAYAISYYISVDPRPTVGEIPSTTRQFVYFLSELAKKYPDKVQFQTLLQENGFSGINKITTNTTPGAASYDHPRMAHVLRKNQARMAGILYPEVYQALVDLKQTGASTYQQFEQSFLKEGLEPLRLRDYEIQHANKEFFTNLVPLVSNGREMWTSFLTEVNQAYTSKQLSREGLDEIYFKITASLVAKKVPEEEIVNMLASLGEALGVSAQRIRAQATEDRLVL